MSYPFDLAALNTQLTEVLGFISTYTRNTFPLFCSTLKLAVEQFNSSTDKLNKRYDYQICKAHTNISLAVAFFKAFEATGNLAYKNLALEFTDAYASYLFIDDIYNQADLGLDTPFIRNHWAVLAFGTIVTEGARNGDEPFGFGFFANRTFTNGVYVFESDLANFFKAYSGALQYKNADSELLEGVEYPIEYFVDRDSYKVFADGSRELTTETKGTVKLVDGTFNGTLSCIYARANNSTMVANSAALSGASLVETNPLIFRTVEFGRSYTSAHTDAAWVAYTMFDLAFKHSNDSKYSNAREIIKWNTLKYALFPLPDNSFYLKKELSTNPLRNPGSNIKQTFVDTLGNPRTVSGYSATRETFSFLLNFLRISINADNYVTSDNKSYAELAVFNSVLTTQYNSTISFTLEVASSLSQLLEVSLDIGDATPNIFTFYWIITGNSIKATRVMTAKSFVQYPDDSVWNITKAITPVQVPAFASTQFQQLTVLGFDTPVSVTSFFSANIEATLVNVSPVDALPEIVYRLQGIVEVIFTDNQGNTFVATLGDTSGVWLTYSGVWNQLEDLGNQVVNIKFRSVSSSATLSLFYVGKPPELLEVPGTIKRASVITRSKQAHILWVGDFQVNNNILDNLQYATGCVPFAKDTLDSSTATTVSPKEQYYCSHQSPLSLFKWKADLAPQNVTPLALIESVQFLSDAQDAFDAQAASNAEGFLLPVYYPYSAENFPNFNTWQWEGLDDDSQHIKHNNRALEDLAKYFYLNPSDAKARKVITNYIEYIYRYYRDNPTKTITRLIPNNIPESSGFNPGMAASEGLIILFANLAGIELAKTYKLLQNRFNYINNEYQNTGTMAGSWTKNQPTFLSSSQTYSNNHSLWMAKIIEFYSELSLHKDSIKFTLLSSDYRFPYLVDIIEGNLKGNNFAHFITNIKEPDYPIIQQAYATGTKQTILLNTDIVGKTITLQFNNLQKEKTSILVDFYYQVNNENNGEFSFDVFQIDYSDFDGIWVFTEAPKITTKIANSTKAVFDIELTIKQIRN